VVVWILSALLGLYCLTVASLYLLLHILTWREMVSIHEGKRLNLILGKTSRNMFLLSLLLSIAILFS